MGIETAAISAFMAANAGTIAAVSTAASIASTAYGAYSQNQNASAMAQQQSEANKAMAIAATDSYDDLSPSEIDAQRQATELSLQNQAEAIQAKGRVNVFAAASGTQGGSVESALFDIEATEARNINDILRQREAGLYQVKQQAESARYGVMQSQGRQAIERPSWIQAGVQIGQQALSGYDKYTSKQSTFNQQQSVKGGV